MDSLAPLLGPIGILAVIGWWFKIFLTNRRMQKMAQIQADMQKHLLDKFDSAEELKFYLESDAGAKLMESVPLERRSPYGKILGSIQSGLILSLSGLAILLIRAAAPGMGPDESLSFLFLGALALALGIGFLLSAAAAYRLSKSWGLVNGQPEIQS